MIAFLRKNWLILSLAIIKIAISGLFFHPDFELHRDELLYADQGNHLDWGYLEVPPMMAFLSYFSKTIPLVDSTWSLKMMMACVGGLTVFITGKMVIQLGGGLFAQFLACWGVMLSAYLRIHVLFQANALDILFWTLICYAVLRYLQLTEENRYNSIPNMAQHTSQIQNSKSQPERASTTAVSVPALTSLRPKK